MTDIAELFQDQPIPSAAELEGQEAPQEAPETPFSLDQGGNEPPAPQEPPAPKHVPLSALQEERQRRQEYKEELDRERQRAAQMEQRFQQVMERMQAAQQPPAQQPVEIPPFEEDPSGHVAALRQRYEQELADLRGYQQQQTQVSQEQARQYEVIQRTTAAEAALMAATPDYKDVTSAFTQRRLAEYQALGLSVAEAQNVVRNDIFNMSAFALQRGADPAKAFYDMAKAAGVTVQPQQAPQPARQPNGQFAAKPPTSLSDVGGAPRQPTEGELTLENLAGMSDADFDKAWAKMARGSVVMPKV